MRILLCISYLGTNYCGYQVQPNGITIEQRLQDSVEAVFGLRCPITGCSRTDAGVHALRFYCTVDISDAPNFIPVEKIRDALNHSLPRDIAVVSASGVDDSFHPRYSVVSKKYKYLIWNERPKNPFLTDRAYHRPKPLDCAVMDEAAKLFIGIHDFAGFCAAGSSVRDTTREIFDAGCERDGGLITFKISGKGFLYNMVRIITGTLIEVSDGKIMLSELPEIIASRDRGRAGFTVPPQGLYLNDVKYE